MLERGKNERGVIEIVSMEELVPSEHLLRKVDKAVEFGKLYEIVEPLYSENEGRSSIDPVVLFKIILLQHLDGLASMWGTLRRAETDIAYRWFLGYAVPGYDGHYQKMGRPTPGLEHHPRATGCLLCRPDAGLNLPAP